MLMGAYDEDIAIGAPRLWESSDLEAITLPGGYTGYEPIGLDEELGLVLSDSEQFYRSVGLDGLGDMGDLHGFFSSIKKVLSKATKPIQKAVTQSVKKVQQLRKKVTPKVLQKLETKVLKKATSDVQKLQKLTGKATPSFLRKPTARLTSIVNKVQDKVTPPMIRKVLQDVAIVSPPGLGPGRQKFLDWLQQDNPELFTAVTGTAIEQQQKQLATLPLPQVPGMPKATVAGLLALSQAATGTAPTPAAQQPSIWDNIVSAAGQIIPAVVQAKAQQDLYKIQLERAKQGQPPLKTEEIAPVIKTQVGLEPETRAAVVTAAGEGFTKLAIPLGIAAAVGLMMVMKKRR
jgi:hypothetical protein